MKNTFKSSAAGVALMGLVAATPANAQDTEFQTITAADGAAHTYAIDNDRIGCVITHGQPGKYTGDQLANYFEKLFKDQGETVECFTVEAGKPGYYSVAFTTALKHSGRIPLNDKAIAAVEDYVDIKREERNSRIGGEITAALN